MLNNYFNKRRTNSNAYLRLLFGLFAFILLHTANAQINTNKIKVDLSSLSFKACSDSNHGLSTVTVQSKQGTTTDFQISFDLPNGVYYQASSLIIISQTGSNDFTISEINISDLNQPVFRIERSSNAPWQINDQVTFTYQKIADCDAVNYSYNGGLFKDAHSITFNDHQGSQTASDTNLSINSYNLLRAFLAVDDIQSVSDNIGGEQTRNIVVRNSGNGSLQRFEHQVNVSPNLQSGYELEFNGSVLTPNISGNIYTYNIDLNLAPFVGQVGDGDNLFENESITLLERMTISQCSWSETTVHSPRWGCAPGNYCQIGSPITGVFMYEEEWAKLELTPINRPLPRWDAPVTYTYQITNDVTANNAYNVNLNIGFFGGTQMSSTTVNPMWGDDNDANRQLSDFRIGSGGVITPQRWQNTNDPSGTGLGSFLIPANYLTTDPDGIGGLEDLDGDGFFDDLRPGASTTISFNLAMTPDNPSCNEFSADYLMNESLKMDLWSVTSCSNPTETKREILNSSRVRREALFNWSDPKDYDQDAEEGQIFNLSFIGNFISTSESPTCNGDEMLTNALNTIYTATVTLPNGISLHSSVDSRYSQIGNQVIFTETNLANFVRDGYILEIPINFPLLVDCATYSGPDYIELDYTTNYSSSCYNQQLHCGSFGVTVHCQSSCDGPTITSFDANRVTAGWTDDSMATKVTLDPSIHATKYYMAKDEMVVTTSAIMINDVKDNLFLEMRYVTDIGFDMSDIIAFESGTITINDLSSGSQTTILNVMPTINTFGTNDNRMTFDLSSYRSIISSTYQFGEGLEADEIQLELHFRFNEDFQEQARLYEFHTFSGQFYSLDNSNNRIGCDIYNERAFFFENKIQIFEVGNNDFVNGCDEKYIGVGLMQNTTFGDKFPNEFRPPLLLKNATIEIPQGMFFENVVTSYEYPNLQPEDEVPGSWNNGLNYSVSGNIVTITPGSRFRHLDQGGSNYPHIKILVRATSATPAVTNFEYSVDYEEYAYSDNPVPKTETQIQIFNYYNKEFYIDNIRPVVIGNSELASFNVTIGNGSVSAIDYNWLRVDSGAGYQLTAAYLVEGGTETPINLINESGIYYIEFGNMPEYTYDTKTVRFEGTFNQCSEQIIKVSQNYDCIGYPTTYSGLPYFHEREYTLQPVPATIQFDVLSQPTSTVDTCSDYNVVLEARNAGEGDLTSPIITFDIPGDISSITIVDIAVEYPRNSGNIESLIPSISGNSVTIDLLQHSFINAQNGLSGSYGANSLDEQIAIINMTLNPQCNYRSNTGTEYIITGNSPCGTPAVGSGSRLASEPVVITGAEPPYSTNSIINSPDLEGCEIETISVETYIVDGITGSNDFIRIVLPDGLTYVPSSFASTGTVTVTYLSINSVGNHQEIEISLPVGANTTDLIAYNFGVESTANICQGTYEIDLSTYVTTSGLNCEGVSCGTTEIVTGEVKAQINVTKPILEKSTFTATTNYINGGTNTNYYVTLGLINTGGEDLTSGAEYNVYCADASGVKVGSSIFTGTLNQEIPVGTSIEESFNFSSVNFCGVNSNIIIEFEPSNTNCFCNTLSILIPSTPSTDYADLEINMSPDNNTVNVGDTIIFTITTENKGPLDATTIILENRIASGYTFVSADNSGILSGNTITWPSFDLANTSTTSVSYTVTVNTQNAIAADFENIAQIIASDQPDSDSTPNNYDGLPLEDDETISNIEFSISDLSIDKRLAMGSTNTPNVGDMLTFEIAVTSDSNGTNVSIEDVVPVGFTVNTVSITNGGILTGNTITWTIPAINASTLVLSYNALVNAPTGAIDEYKNIAQVTASDQKDPDSTPNNDDGDQSEDDEDSILDISVVTANLSIDKRLAASSSTSPNVGDTITFEIELTNAGPNEATNISVSDIIPVGFSVNVASISNNGVLSGNTITWNLMSLSLGNRTLTYDVIVNAPTGFIDEYKNIAQVIAVDQYDPDSIPDNDDGDQSEDDEDAYNTMVTQSFVDIDITKTANVLEATLGDTVVFTITAQNLGNTLATNIVIDEKIPNGFELVSSNTLNGIYDSVLGEWTIPSMNSNEISTLTITVLVVKGESYTNIVTLSYVDQIDTNTDNDEDQVTIDVKADCLIIYNEFSPNNDGANEVFFIECIDEYPNNYLEIFNRWGTKVYEKKAYNNTWDGTSMGRATLKVNEKLPVGTYYYSLDLGDGKSAPKAGWLYLNR